MIVHVRNFGKIESADIDLSDLTIFVGENNSGKTYLMQLIYGLIDCFFYSKKFDDFLGDFPELKINTDVTEIKASDIKFYSSFENELNQFIKLEKNEIVKRIFNTDKIKIGSLSVEFGNIEHDFYIKPDHVSKYEHEKSLQRYMFIEDNKEILDNVLVDFSDEQHVKEQFTVMKILLLSIVLTEMIFNIPLIHDYNSIIYLPASRSGLMLLHTDYMANEIDNNNFLYHRKNFENKLGLTQPVYKFLTSLLIYKTNEMISDENKALISFIDKNIINGSMEKTGNTMRYKPASSENSLPIYLSSSLVSEVTPIYQILSGIQKYVFILYDEVETGQHPTKQLQLARLLVRMVNAGYRMIVSTHSDTMASAINNLLALSFKNNKSDIIKKLGYEEADILKSTNVKAYQFIIGENGKTRVIEVQSHFSIGLGFDFDLFNKANDKIYNDAVAIAEVD